MPLFDYAVYYEDPDSGRGVVNFEGRLVAKDWDAAFSIASKRYLPLCAGGEAAEGVVVAVREFGGEVRPAPRVEEKREDES